MATLTAPSWGRKAPGAGRVANVDPGIEYQGTTTQLAGGFFPWVAGSGAPHLGVPVGRHMLWGEPVCLDPLEWLRAGWVTNPGMFLLGQPGVGKSALAKRLICGMVATGTTALILGDPRPDYSPLVRCLGGQVIQVGRGMDRINPLDAGPLAQVLPHLDARQAAMVAVEIRSRRLSLLLGLCTLVRRGPVTNLEEHLLGCAIDLLSAKLGRDPIIPDVLNVLAEGPEPLLAAARIGDADQWRPAVSELIATLTVLCTGVLEGIFDAATTTPIDLDAPAVSVDISAIAASGTGSDQLVAAAMLSTWAYSFAVVDAAALMAECGLAPRRSFLGVMDELWRALRGAPGLVDHADHASRLNRSKSMSTLMITHTLDDLEALASAEDKAKARGFFDRSAIKIMAALPGRDLDRICQTVRLSQPERDLVSSWAAGAFTTTGIHPGRGNYLIKVDESAGLPIKLQFVGEEARLYDTDAAIRESDPTRIPGGRR